MTSKSAGRMFRDAWNDRFEEIGISPPPGMDDPKTFALQDGEKAQLQAMQNLANFFMASPGFTARIAAHKNGGLSLVVAHGDVELALPFECRSLDPDYAKEMGGKFSYPSEITPTGYTAFSSSIKTDGFAASFADSASEGRQNWHDMTGESNFEDIKELVVAVLADKVAAALHAQAALNFLETIKPKL